ncbi:MAG: hypothetical protein HQK65_17040 [Desulfamplus sp.]|nr:hypothetical protein [Desulfamplus sp.]
MKFLYVAGSGDVNGEVNRALFKAVSGQTNSFLYSLVGGMDKKEYKCLAMSKAAWKIEECQKIFGEGKVFIDSGGYSIIKGDIPPEEINSVIDLWGYYAEHQMETVDFLYSLDIPVSLIYDSLNTKDTIYTFNKQSLSILVELVKKYPQLKNKIYFVWHFKMHSQYAIWKALYDELDIKNYVNSRAIGGMVSLRKITGINFSPFIGMIYRCILDYLHAGNFDIDFRLHFLGVNNKYDRFQIVFMEKLCEYYFDHNITAKFSYDSVNYAETIRRKIVDMKDPLPFYSFENNNFEYYETILKVPDHVIKSVYQDHDLYTYVIGERDRIGKKKKGSKQKVLENTNSFVPLNVMSNMAIDKLFKQVIDEYELVDIFTKSKSFTTIKNKLRCVLEIVSKAHPTIFTNNVNNSIIENFEITHEFHEWFTENQTYDQLDFHMKYFINNIDFPEKLR